MNNKNCIYTTILQMIHRIHNRRKKFMGFKKSKIILMEKMVLYILGNKEIKHSHTIILVSRFYYLFLMLHPPMVVAFFLSLACFHILVTKLIVQTTSSTYVSTTLPPILSKYPQV